MGNQQEIDVGKVLKDKNPRLYRFAPKFFIKKLKSLVHEEEINEILSKLENKEGLEFIKDALALLNINSQSSGFEKIPKKEGIIIVANHPLGGLDGVALIKEIGKHRTDIQFLVNDILTKIDAFKTLFVPVNKHGVNSRENLNRIDELYQSDKCIVLFPAGMVSRKEKKIIKDLDWKKSFITKVKKHNKPIYPIFISGKNSKRFYRTANIRKNIGLKTNLEMMLLADEMFKQSGSTITFTMGNPIQPNTFTKDKTNHEWAQLIKKHVYQLEINPNFEFSETINNEKSH